MQDRLLNAYLVGTVEEAIFNAKSASLRDEVATVQEALDCLGNVDAGCADAAVAIFDWSQNAAEIWRGSNNAVRREILDCVCLNRTLSDVSLYTVKRKPFDILAEGPVLKKSRGDGI